MRRPAKKTITRASLDSTPDLSPPLEGFPVGCNWKVPRDEVDDAEASVVVAAVVVVAGVGGATVVGLTVVVGGRTVGGMVVDVAGGETGPVDGMVAEVPGIEGTSPLQGPPNPV